MHDAKKRPLKEGDFVLIPARIAKLHPGDDFCNVDLESIFGRRPDGAKERICAINTGVLLKAVLNVYEEMECISPQPSPGA